ncbi:GntR family transcriptional regulator [Fodinicola acaciae]|uniref:GntR family transcriptional regulator n=1 Tax=Fodinicola acaciae TaxID=2681555 RepID=UPI0013D50DE1|nr:GntR family transcriptional regulator [Fodinicola acaciae]
METDTVAPEATAPRWEQIAAALAGELRTAPAGSRLPSEAEQCRRFAVSRVTLRQALTELQNRGLVESRAGRGWFVAAPAGAPDRTPVTEPPGKLMSFTEMARSKGHVPDSEVLAQELRPATFEEAERLGLVAGTSLFSLRRLRRLNGLPVAVDHSLVPGDLLPDALGTDFSTASLHDAFRAAAAAPAGADLEIEAIVADAEFAGLLGVEEGFPLLKVRQLIRDAGGRPIERGVIVYRADRYRYRASVHS